MIDKDDMNKLLKHIRGIATNVNQVVYRVNSTGNITSFVKLSVSRNQPVIIIRVQYAYTAL